jgi:uncharacterized protein
MPGPGAIVRELHRLQRTAHNLREEIARAPRQIELQKARVEKSETTSREAHENLKRLKLETHKKETDLKALNQQIDKHQIQLNQASSRKEYDGLKTEIALDQNHIKQIEDEILNLFEESDRQAAELPAADKAIVEAKTEAARAIQEIETRKTDLATRLEQVEKEIKEVEEQLPVDVRPMYDRLIGARGEDALAAVEGRICLACYTEITAQNYNDLRNGQFVLCKSCGRILYLPE